MERLRAVIDTHNQKMILPGPGDIKYILPPGSMGILFEKAPSGHLVMVIDAYDAIRVGGSGALPNTKSGIPRRTPTNSIERMASRSDAAGTSL